MKNPQKQLIFTCFPAILRSRPCARFPLPAAYFSATVFVGTELFLPAFSPLPRARLFILPFRPILIRTRRVNSPPNFPVKISRTLSACIFCTPCRSSRRTMFSPSVCVRFSRNKPPARRNAAFARLTSAAERRRQLNQTEIAQTTAVLLSFCVIRRTTSLFPAPASNSASKKHIKKKRSGETLLRNDSEIKNSTYFFAAATCFATSSLRSSLFFSKPSPIT